MYVYYGGREIPHTANTGSTNYANSHNTPEVTVYVPHFTNVLHIHRPTANSQNTREMGQNTTDMGQNTRRNGSEQTEMLPGWTVFGRTFGSTKWWCFTDEQ